MKIFYIILSVLNLFTMCLYGIDKILARKGARRIRERTLITATFLLGGIGAMFGMVLFNHKTSKLKFRLLVPFAAVLTAAVIAAVRNDLLSNIFLY